MTEPAAASRLFRRHGCTSCAVIGRADHFPRGSVEALDDFEHLYNAYHALGGNGTGTEIYKRVKELPMKQGKE